MPFRSLPAALALTVVACRSASSAGERATPTQPVSSASSSSPSRALPSASSPVTPVDAGKREAPRLDPLAASEPLVALEVPGFRAAVVSLPLGASERRPVVVALHGNYDRPEWQCEVWREITRGFPFVLCPRGTPRSDAPKSEDRWEYGSLPSTERELGAALDALKARYPAYVDPGPVVFTGFSLGAILGKTIVTHRPGSFARAVLTEGGFEGWSAARAKQYAEANVGRVLFACGQPSCVQSAKAAARVLEKQGVPARVASGGSIGHTYDGPVARAIAAEWSWLVEGDSRFAGE